MAYRLSHQRYVQKMSTTGSLELQTEVSGNTNLKSRCNVRKLGGIIALNKRDYPTSNCQHTTVFITIRACTNSRVFPSQQPHCRAERETRSSRLGPNFKLVWSVISAANLTIRARLEVSNAIISAAGEASHLRQRLHPDSPTANLLNSAIRLITSDSHSLLRSHPAQGLLTALGTMRASQDNIESSKRQRGPNYPVLFITKLHRSSLWLGRHLACHC
ncbi:hypothetical protein F5141DRAFT_427190 [Pisolithus sp. B1]|nr:hypothetical protein F5141DRAFT_427190 [Pisolithus sp. B1]